MAGTTIRELITKFGFEADDAVLDKLDKRVANLKVGLLALTGVTAAVVAGLAAITKSAANAGDDLDAQSSLFGFAVEQLQIWTRAAGYGDIAAEEFTSSIQYLNRIVGDAARGQKEAAKPFKDLGVNLKDSRGNIRLTSDILADLGERFSHIPDPAKRASLAMDLFGRGGQRMGRFLAESADGIKRATEIVQAFGFYTAETAAQADAANDAMEDSATLIRGMKNEIGIGLLPVMKAVADRFNAWVLANREIIKQRIDKFVTGVTKAFDFLSAAATRVYRWVESLIRLLGGLENVLKLVAIGLLAAFGGSVALAVQSLIALVSTLGLAFLATWAEALIVPVLVAAAIGLIALAIEDVYVWLKGGDSVIGDFLGSWVEFKEKALVQFGDFLEGLGVIVTAIKMLFSGLWGALSGAFGIVVALWRGDLEGFKASFMKWVKGIGDILTSPLILAFGVVETLVTGVLHMIEGAYRVAVGLVQAISNIIVPPSISKMVDLAGRLIGRGVSAAADLVGGGTSSSFGAPPSLQTFLLPRQVAAAAGGQGVVVQGGISVGPTTVTLPPGTPEDHAKEMTRIFHENLEQAITHSLNMSARPGG